MIDPAPKVEAAKAASAVPRAAPNAEPVTASRVQHAEKAPAVEPAFAEPPTENGSLVESATKPAVGEARVEQSLKMGVDALRATQPVAFEAHAAVIIGPVERNACEKYIPCYAERTFISYGEVKRFVLVVGGNIFVYVDISDPAPLYTIPIMDVMPEREDPDQPSFYSHTISPEANTGLPFDNRSKESLGTVLLKNENGHIAFQFAFDKRETGDDILERFIAALESAKGKGAKKIGGKI